MASLKQIKRFYQTACAVQISQGYQIALDDKPIRTPSGQTVTIPNANLAEALAREWNAQNPFIDLKRMGLNQLVNSAIDRVMPDPAQIRDEIAAYGASDLLCYRAEGPVALAARQAAVWDPMLEWVAARYGAHMKITSGILAVVQDAGAMNALLAPVLAADAFQLSALRAAVGLCGSLIVTLALADGYLDANAAWRGSRIDEDWQREKWGQDAEADAAQANAFAAFNHAANMLSLLRQDNRAARN